MRKSFSLKSLITTNFDGLWTDSIPEFSVYSDINTPFKLAHFLTEYLNKTRLMKHSNGNKVRCASKFSPRICISKERGRKHEDKEEEISYSIEIPPQNKNINMYIVNSKKFLTLYSNVFAVRFCWEF